MVGKDLVFGFNGFKGSYNLSVELENGTLISINDKLDAIYAEHSEVVKIVQELKYDYMQCSKAKIDPALPKIEISCVEGEE